MPGRLERRARRDPARDPGSGLIRAVLFDAGATLVHPSVPVEVVYARELARDGCAVPADEIGRELARAWEEVHARPQANRYGGVRGEADFWRAFLNRVRGRLDGGVVSEEAFGRLAAHFRDPGSWSIFPDVPGALDELERLGLALGVVSNWDSYLPQLLEGLGLARRFATVAVSAIEETGKPHPEIFLRACRRLGVAPGEALHVGDSLAEDYEGARGAGLSAVLLDREGRHPDVAERIDSLDGLEAAILRAP